MYTFHSNRFSRWQAIHVKTLGNWKTNYNLMFKNKAWFCNIVPELVFLPCLHEWHSLPGKSDWIVRLLFLDWIQYKRKGLRKGQLRVIRLETRHWFLCLLVMLGWFLLASGAFLRSTLVSRILFAWIGKAERTSKCPKRTSKGIEESKSVSNPCTGSHTSSGHLYLKISGVRSDANVSLCQWRHLDNRSHHRVHGQFF